MGVVCQEGSVELNRFRGFQPPKGLKKWNSPSVVIDSDGGLVIYV